MSELNVLINDQELAESLAVMMISRLLAKQSIKWSKTDSYIGSCIDEKIKTGYNTFDFVLFHSSIEQDLGAWQKNIKKYHKKNFRKLVNYLVSYIENLDSDQFLIDLALKSGRTGIIQTLAQRLCDHRKYISIRQYRTSNSTLLLRNIIHNENILEDLMTNHTPFWFLDTGYTNHLHDKKLWHRVVRNHVHAMPDLTRSWPSDRLRNLPVFPRPWHGKGSRILIVENSFSHYRLYSDNIQAWRTRIAHELDQYDNTMEREWYVKNNKKERISVYRYLEQDPKSWYCVITDCSAAAIEAIWLGIPVITLRRHITAPVARNTISRLHDLYRGPVGDWLCALTYSQFTVAELQDGTAHKILRRYHGA